MDTRPGDSWPTIRDLVACPSCRSTLDDAGPDGAVCKSCRHAYPRTEPSQIDLRPPDTLRESLPPAFKPMGRARRFVRRVHRGIGRRAFSAYNLGGDRVECCLCGWKGRRFLPAGDAWRGERLCPSCGSLERYRAMFLYLRKFGGLGDRPLTLLEVAPKPCFATLCNAATGVRYLSTDLLSEYAAVLSDLTRFGFAAGVIDVLVCSHVMEHVPDDSSAFREIGRVLKPDGFGLIMVPLIEGPTFEDPDAGPEDYERLYGQFDHVRCYGPDIEQRMTASGLAVSKIDLFETFGPKMSRRHGLLGDDRFLFRVSKWGDANRSTTPSGPTGAVA